MSTIRLLIRPTLFTATFCGSCFCGAAIYQYETRKRPYQSFPNWISSQQQRYKSNTMQKYSQIRQNINNWYNQLSTGEKLAGGTIFLNLLVFTAWRFQGLRPIMGKYFISHLSPTKIPLSPMILSCFSHNSALHLAFNMYALYSFSNIATQLLGPEQFVGLFLSAGAVSSLASIACRLIQKRPFVGSLGASGALLGVVAYVCVARPDSRLLLFFIPIAAGNAIKCLMVVDTIGVFAKWTFIDHAAHLGGSLFGVWYAYEGEKFFYRHKKDVVDRWIKIKNSFGDD